MDTALVSAVLPTYNYGRFVGDAVSSVLAQSYPHVEVIVVDDGSTDDTRKRLEPYMGRIRYIYQKNQGQHAARNAGIQAARGQYIGLLDSDDMWHPRKLELQMNYIARNPDARIVASNLIIDLSRGWPSVNAADEITMRKISIEQLVVCARFAPSGVIIRKDCFDTVGYFRPNIVGAEDRDMWIRLASQFEINWLDAPLMFYRNHGGNISTAATRMDRVDRLMLDGVFKDIQSLHGRPILRRKAYSYAACMASFLYTAGDNHRTAMARILQSLVLWPFPYERKTLKGTTARLKMLGVIWLRMLGLKRPHGSMALEGAGSAHA